MTQDETMHLLSKLSTMDTANSWASSPVDLSLAHTSDQITSSGVILSLARSTSSTPPSTAAVFGGSRKQREFTPDCKKDESYWDRRRRNNEAAKRSREKRRISDVLLEQRVLELTRENQILRSELFALKEKFGIPLNHHMIDPNAVNLPVPENNLRGRRNKLLSSVIPAGLFSPCNNASNTGSKHTSVTSVNANGHNGREEEANEKAKKSRRSSKQDDMSGCMLAAYVSASSPLSSSSSLSDSAVGCSSENQPSQSTSPACSVSSSPVACNGGGTPSLPHKLRHKAATRYTCNEGEPPNDHALELRNCGSSSPSSPKVTARENRPERQESPGNGKNNCSPSDAHALASVREGYSPICPDITSATSALLLKEQNYTLTQQLARLACEVASLKTILVPSSNSPASLASHVCPPDDLSMRSQSVASSPPMDTRDTHDDMDCDVHVKQETTRLAHSTCDSSSEENCH